MPCPIKPVLSNLPNAHPLPLRAYGLDITSYVQALRELGAGYEEAKCSGLPLGEDLKEAKGHPKMPINKGGQFLKPINATASRWFPRPLIFLEVKRSGAGEDVKDATRHPKMPMNKGGQFIKPINATASRYSPWWNQLMKRPL